VNARDYFTWLCRSDDFCRKSIEVKRGRSHRQWTCVLPKGHEGTCARVTLMIRRFNEDGPLGHSEFDSSLPVEATP